MKRLNTLVHLQFCSFDSKAEKKIDMRFFQKKYNDKGLFLHIKRKINLGVKALHRYYELYAEVFGHTPP